MGGSCKNVAIQSNRRYDEECDWSNWKYKKYVEKITTHQPVYLKYVSVWPCGSCLPSHKINTPQGAYFWIKKSKSKVTGN